MADEELEAIRHALNLARTKGFSEVDLRFAGIEFEATLGPNGIAQASLSPFLKGQDDSSACMEEPGVAAVEAPCVGYFQQGRNPLAEGRSVQQGEILASIVVLGLANDVESPHTGEVIEVLVEEGQPVEFGQPLARMKVNP